MSTVDNRARTYAVRLLLVEDDDVDVALVQHALRSVGLHDWRLDVAETLRDARKRLVRCAYDLVLLDGNLPDCLLYTSDAADE